MDDASVEDAIRAAFGDQALALLDEPAASPSASPVETKSSRLQGPRISALEAMIASIDDTMRRGRGAALSTGFASRRRDSSRVARHVTFSLAGLGYAAPMANVLEISRPPAVTPLPGAPDWLMGVTNLRGDILSVIDLRAFLQLPQAEADPANRLVVVRSLQEDISVGFLVDRVGRIRDLGYERITDPAAPLDERISAYMRGICELDEQMVIVLDLEKLLLSVELRQFEPN